MNTDIKFKDRYDIELAKLWPGFLFRSPTATIIAKGKGQTRNWLIIAPFPAGKLVAKREGDK
jgi:hypothetical protein